MGRIVAVLRGGDGTLSSVPLEFRSHESPVKLTSFNISPYLQAPWNTTEFLIDYSGDWTGRYTAIHSGGSCDPRIIAPEELYRVLVVRHAHQQADELVDITTDEIAALSKALITIIRV